VLNEKKNNDNNVILLNFVSSH